MRRTPTLKECEVCASPFRVKPSAINRAKTCSWDCRSALLSQRYKGQKSPFIGHSHTDHTKRQISSTLLGRKLSKIHRERIALYPRTMAHRSHIAEAMRGPSHPNWKGGITAENHRVRHSLEYKEWRRAVFERDDYTCQECGERGGDLHADHIKPFAFYPALRSKLSNGRTLCVPCHRETPTYGRNTLTA